MNVTPLLHAPLVIQLHVYAAVAAALLGAVVLWRRKGTRLHRMLGRVWVLLMLVVAGSSFFIHTIRLWGPFSPIHLLSVATILGLAAAIWRIRSGDVAGHRAAMRSLYAGALGIAGLFTLLPGRLMSKVVFGPDASPPTVLTGMVVLAVLAVVAVAAIRAGSRRSAAFAVASLVVMATALHVTPAIAMEGPGVTPLGVLTHTPLWVWAVSALVLWLGYSRTKDRVVPAWRIAVLPVVVLILAVGNLSAEHFAAFALVGMALGAIVGLGIGLAIADHGRTEHLGGGRLKLRGEWLSFAVILLVFAVRYVRGAIMAVDPTLATRPGFQLAVMALSGFSAALLLARSAGRLSALAR